MFGCIKSARATLILRGSFSSVWPRVLRAWQRAPYVYRGPIGYGAVKPYEYMLLERLISRECEQLRPMLKECLSHENSQVVAYAIVGLRMLGHLRRSDILAATRMRGDVIAWKIGSVTSESTLEEFGQLYGSASTDY